MVLLMVLMEDIDHLKLGWSEGYLCVWELWMGEEGSDCLQICHDSPDVIVLQERSDQVLA